MDMRMREIQRSRWYRGAWQRYRAELAATVRHHPGDTDRIGHLRWALTYLGHVGFLRALLDTDPEQAEAAHLVVAMMAPVLCPHAIADNYWRDRESA